MVRHKRVAAHSERTDYSWIVLYPAFAIILLVAIIEYAIRGDRNPPPAKRESQRRNMH